jgi:signal transduction histidine kinase
VAAASRIEQYIRQIERQLAYAALPQLDPSDVELRRIEFLKLLRQVPEVTDIVAVDAEGREQIAVSRLGMDVVGSGKDRSQDAAFKVPKRGAPWFGPVYFKKETEPYMTVAVRSSGDRAPVTIAELNLKFIWDVVSRIKVGERGKAYVVDRSGYLVADPDIGLVLRKTHLADLAHVKAALGNEPHEEAALRSHDPAGVPVLAAWAPIESLDWMVFVEQPVAEVYAKLNASIVRTGLLLLAGLVVSAIVALILARGMVRPIRTLSEGARRIGEGDLDQRIEVKTGDELEALADRFNRMSGQLKESYAGLERKVEARTSELKNSLEQQTAISEILRVISGSPTDVKPVLEAVAERAAHLCAATYARVLLIDGTRLEPIAGFQDGHSASEAELADTVAVPLDRSSLTGRAAIERRTIHEADIMPLRADEYPGARANVEMFGLHAVLVVPLMRESGAYGGIILARTAPGRFRDDQVALVETFARQAAIAIDNVRLFNETRVALAKQTAISDILRVTAVSPTDVEPVLTAVAERAATLCDAPYALVFLIDGDRLVPRATHGAGDPGHLAKLRSVPIRRDTVNGRAVIDRTAVQVEDLVPLLDTEFPGARQFQEGFGFRSVLAIPVLREGSPTGVIFLARREPRPFDPEQVALVQTFAHQLAIALDNVRLFDETKEALDQQRASGEVLAAISSSIADTAPVFDKILGSCERLFAGKVGQINLIDDAGMVHLAAYHGPGLAEMDKIFPFPVDDRSSTGLSIERRAVLHYPDIDADADVPPIARAGWKAQGLRSLMVAPMLWEGKGVGAVFVGREEPGAYTDKEIALLRTFADQAVIAIQNARLFREIADKSRQLEIANQHKSAFLASMSHELRTPLNAIIGFSEVLLERYFGELNEKQDDYMKDIHSSGKHLLALINEVLDLSKVEAGRMELDRTEFDLAAALADAMTLIRERAQQHAITLGLDAAPDLGTIHADERKFKQIVLNLLSNAVKFTPDGGRIEVRARRDANAIEVAVRDTGIGIAPEDQDAVFEEFRQVGRDYMSKHEGTGLGLALCKRLVELHGGRIWLESAPGHGSTFFFTLPEAP